MIAGHCKILLYRKYMFILIPRRAQHIDHARSSTCQRQTQRQLSHSGPCRASCCRQTVYACSPSWPARMMSATSYSRHAFTFLRRWRWRTASQRCLGSNACWFSSRNQRHTAPLCSQPGHALSRFAQFLFTMYASTIVFFTLFRYCSCMCTRSLSTFPSVVMCLSLNSFCISGTE